MPRCSYCKKWSLFLKLQNGLCSSCQSMVAYYSMEFENQLRILTDSLAIIHKTKSIDTLNSRKELCLKAHAKMTEINNKYHVFPAHLLPSFGSILEACAIAESHFEKEDIENPVDMDRSYRMDELDVLVESEPEPTADCPPISCIESEYFSLSPRSRDDGISYFNNPDAIDRDIAGYEKQIEYYYRMKSLYKSKSMQHSRVWEKRFEHCFNSRNQDFEIVESAAESLALLRKRRSLYLDFEGAILNTIRENPGVFQKDLPALIDDDMSQFILSSVRELAEAGKIIRIKKGRAYTLFVKLVEE